MKPHVNDNCIGCGLCASICPQVFQLNANGLAEPVVEEVPADAENAAQEARTGCPVDAIDLV